MTKLACELLSGPGQELRGGVPGALLCDWQISALAKAGMIKPYVAEQVRYDSESVSKMLRVASFGQGPAGYDVRLGVDFSRWDESVDFLDPHHMPGEDQLHRWRQESGAIIVRAGEKVDGVTMETFDMPGDVQATCKCKSTYTRLGLTTQTTGIEPGFRGTITVQLMNNTRHDIKVWPQQGILQVLFWQIAVPTSTYGGSFQGQRGVVTHAGQVGEG